MDSFRRLLGVVLVSVPSRKAIFLSKPNSSAQSQVINFHIIERVPDLDNNRISVLN